jgi:mannan endo-1,4-beta-mannosidase
MRKYLISLIRIVLLLAMMIPAISYSQQPAPANPNATPEARALLRYLQGISGKHILTGQHNFPASGDRNTQFAAAYIGKTPVIWSQDFGFAAGGDKDSYLSRPAIVQEAIRQYKKGAIVNLCWHAVPPTADEPVTFQPLAGADSSKPLASVQGRLTDEQYHDILTPGTELNKKWMKQVDQIAFFLRQLQDAKVPVLWRPYHEMNGDWFWWGGRSEGTYTTVALYKQIYDRFVKFHKLNNLVWVWSVDRPSRPGREFGKFYPGTKYLDILAIDIYGNDFNQSYYDSLLILSKGKPVTLGEVGTPPAPEILRKQPGWIYWVVWAGMTRETSQSDYDKLLAYPPVTFLEDASYAEGTREYRRACGLEALSVNRKTDFTGSWKLDECGSKISGDMSNSSAPHKIAISQKENLLSAKFYSVSEYSDDEATDFSVTLDGKENRSSSIANSVSKRTAIWSSSLDTIKIDSKVTFRYDGRTNEMKSKEIWYIIKRGPKLVIDQTIDDFMGQGPRKVTLVYEKN